MLQKLKERWKVNTVGLTLIILTFAIGGTLCGELGKKVIDLTGLKGGFLWWGIYILLVSVLWPLCVIIISIPFGQFVFFRNYIKKIFGRFFTHKNKTQFVAIFASGAGSNAQKIIDKFRNSKDIKISLIVCNKEEAGVQSIAEKENIPFLLINKTRFFKGDAYLPEFESREISLIVLAGFLWKIPSELIKQYPDKIINIHPALLPKYGGKGMFGYHVHEAVIAAGETESGISIHYVDEIYDHGKIIFKAKCPVEKNDTPDSLAQKIHVLEHLHYPEIVKDLLQKNINSEQVSK